MLLYLNGAPKNVCASKPSGGATSSSSGGSSKAKTKGKSEDETIFSTTSLLGRDQLSGGYDMRILCNCYKLMLFLYPDPPLFPTCKSSSNYTYIPLAECVFTSWFGLVTPSVRVICMVQTTNGNKTRSRIKTFPTALRVDPAKTTETPDAWNPP